jgi:hypothetical protein
LFANDRELLACAKCGLQEDVAFRGQLITSHPDSVGEDTGLRFVELADGAAATLTVFLFETHKETKE